jgi:hypothetical protein
MEGMTVRDYAIQKRITMGTAYRRLWEGRVRAKKFLGRWLILPETSGLGNTDLLEKHDQTLDEER